MIIDDVEYDDEDEWRVARVVSVKLSGEEHRIQTRHHGEMVRNHYVCQDCKTVYFDESSDVRESPVVVHGAVHVDGKFIEKLVDLALYYGEDLQEIERFIRKVASRYKVEIDVPNLEDLQAESLLEEEEE